MRDAENIRKVEQTGIDWMGFIFYPKSSRNITEKPQYLPTSQRRIGLFVNEPIETIKDKVFEYELDGIQLHGQESPQFCVELSRTIGKAMFEQLGYPKPIFLIKAFNISDASDFEKVSEYDGTCQYYLFDTKSDKVGGSGKTWDWSLLEHYKGYAPFLLSGGIGPEHLESVKQLKHPRLIGIDLNSRFEISPAMKDSELIGKFVQELR